MREVRSVIEDSGRRKKDEFGIFTYVFVCMFMRKSIPGHSDVACEAYGDQMKGSAEGGQVCRRPCRKLKWYVEMKIKAPQKRGEAGN